ncbi:MAG: DUF1800 domain-containing protein [Rhodobacterales bacterium]|nr:DUF1800 domain-containing protein [Rhodobacterales bacterium]MDX5498845.1 DUF1800 domain-containing protein [Rhodobacterales bacterium]
MTTPKGLAAHRFGYGPRAGRLPDHPPAALLGKPDRMLKVWPGQSTAQVLMKMAKDRQADRDAANPEIRRKIKRVSFMEGKQQALVNARLELARAVDSDDSYRERLVRFWADHFTVIARGASQLPMTTAFADDAIRPNIAGRFATLLRAAITHPAMLTYLNQSSSVGPDSVFGQRVGRGLNENLARELLELHTLGVDGGYTQTDVRQAALLLTGLSVNAEKGTVYLDKRAEPGAETVLGKSYGGARKARIEDIYQLLDDLAAHPATARHISWKLAVHFVSDTPDRALIEDLAAIWLKTGGDLRAVSTALSEHPAANRPTLEKARQPFDFIVAALRALDVGGQQITGWNDATLRRIALNPMAAMGQTWQEPNGPDGWEEDFSRWITPQALATRIDWGIQMPRRLRKTLPDARSFVDMALADMADDDLVRLVARSETEAEGVGLVLASPRFNRR